MLYAELGLSSTEIRYYSANNTFNKTITQFEHNIPVIGKADIVVVGGGVSGVMSALNAASQGLTVILIENRNYFGHEITGTFQCRIKDSSLRFPSHSSLSQQMYKELVDSEIIKGENIDPVLLRNYLLRKVSDNTKIDIYLYALGTGVVLKDGRVHGVVFSSRSGKQAVLAKSVIDATGDARIVAAAGGKISQTTTGENIARRFVAIDRKEDLSFGSRTVAKNLGIRGDSIFVHPNYIELAVNFNFGGDIDDIAGNLSMVHAETLRKSFALGDQLASEGIHLSNFTPAPESWFDKVPMVSCRARWDENLSNSDIALPTGVDGLVVTGRTVLPDMKSESLRNLLEIGEFSGTVAIKMARQVTGLPDYIKESPSIQPSYKGIQAREISEFAEPGVNQQWINQPAMELPVAGEYDVLVIGGGTSGAIAAIAAARQGVSVAVVEILPNLGGISSNRVNSYYWGVPWKSFLRQELGEQIYLRKSTSYAGPLEKVLFSGEHKKLALQELAINAGVKIYYQSLATGAVVEGQNIRGVIVDNASGRHVLLSKIVIDATGHAGIAMASGAKFNKGRETDGFMNEIEHGPLRDPTHLADISSSYIKYPSYAESMNIRESRRIIGDYIVTFSDVIHERNFSDVVCRWRSNYDSHLPTSANQSDLAQDWTGILGVWRRPVIGSIPYRSLTPKGLDNILVAAMAYSTDHDALIGGRMQPDLEHLGEAAGVAAAMACNLKVTPRNVPVGNLQAELVRLGVLRNSDVPDLTVKNSPSLELLHRQDLWRAQREKDFPPEDEGKRLTFDEAVKLLGTEKALEGMVNIYLDGEKAITELRPLMNSQNSKIYEETAVLLGLLGDRSAIPALLKFLKDRNTRRFEYTLSYASSRPSLPLYWISAILLGRFQEDSAVPELLDILNSPPFPENYSSMVRQEYGDDMFRDISTCPPSLASFVIVALGRIGDNTAIERILPFLQVSYQVPVSRENRDFEIAWGVRTNAAWALSRMGNNSGVPVLLDLLESDQALVRNYARQLLKEITGDNLN